MANNVTKTRLREQAAQLLPCLCGGTFRNGIVDPNVHDGPNTPDTCPAYFRPVVAAALMEASQSGIEQEALQWQQATERLQAELAAADKNNDNLSAENTDLRLRVNELHDELATAKAELLRYAGAEAALECDAAQTVRKLMQQAAEEAARKQGEILVPIRDALRSQMLCEMCGKMQNPGSPRNHREDCKYVMLDNWLAADKPEGEAG